MKLIGITGLARAGKDSFCDLSQSVLNSVGINSKRYAFANALKEESDELLSKYAGISAFTEKTHEKEIIRPFLVTYGTHIRRKMNPNCWVDKINDNVLQDIHKGLWVFITDVRYENEIDWIHKLGGRAVHIHREGNLAPNTEELENDPILKRKADHHVSWNDFPKEDMNKINLTINKILQYNPWS